MEKAEKTQGGKENQNQYKSVNNPIIRPGCHRKGDVET